MENVVIVNAKRTAFGNLGGKLAPIYPVPMAAFLVNEVIKDLIDPADIDMLILGKVQDNAEGNSPVRQVALTGGWPKNTNCLLTERACCSSMYAIGTAFEKIACDRAKIIVAGGFESLSNTPYSLPQLRFGARLGDITIADPLVIRNPALGRPNAAVAGEVALEYGQDREAQDRYGLQSQLRAANAQAKGWLAEEIVPIEVPQKKGAPIIFDQDEHIRPNSTYEALEKMKPVYGSPTVTAGNASGLNDGATALLIMSESEAKARGLKPLIRIVEYSSLSIDPSRSATLPAEGVMAILKNTGMTLDQMEILEMNEAFAAMPLVSMQILGEKDPKKVEKLNAITNVNGGAIAIGHPTGATGGRMTMTMMYEMLRKGYKYGCASICGAIGQADAVILEAI